MSELFDAATANEFSTELRSIQSSYASAKKTLNTLDGEVSDLHRDVDAVEGELLSLGRKSGAPLSVPNGLAVSEGCARHLGAIVLLSAKRGKCLEHLSEVQRQRLMLEVETIIGADAVRAPLTNTDIPLPEQYAEELVKLCFALWQGTQVRHRLRTRFRRRNHEAPTPQNLACV